MATFRNTGTGSTPQLQRYLLLHCPWRSGSPSAKSCCIFALDGAYSSAFQGIVLIFRRLYTFLPQFHLFSKTRQLNTPSCFPLLSCALFDRRTPAVAKWHNVITYHDIAYTPKYTVYSLRIVFIKCTYSYPDYTVILPYQRSLSRLHVILYHRPKEK